MHGKEKPLFNLRSESEKPRLMNRNKQVPISFGFREKPLQCVQNQTNDLPQSGKMKCVNIT